MTAPARSETFLMRRAFVLVLLALFGYLSWLVFKPFLTYLLLGGLFVYVLHPLYRRVLGKVKRPGIAATIILLFFATALLAPFTWVGVEVVTTAARTVEGFDPEEFIRSTDAALDRAFDALGIPRNDGESTSYQILNATLPALQAKLQASIPRVISLAGTVTIGLFVMVFAMYYGLRDGGRFVGYVRSALPLDARQSNSLFEEIRRTVDAVFFGHVLVSAIQGAIGGIGFILFGVPNGLFWGVVMMLLALIPVIGPPVVWLPAVIYLFATGHTGAAIGLLIWSALLVSTLDNVIRPRIVGNRADIHPLVVLVGVLGGIVAFGVIGFVTGPLVIAILVAVVNFWRTDYLPAQRGEGPASETHPAVAPPDEGG